MSEAQFFFPKRKREFSFEHGAKRRRRKSVRPWPAVEDLNGGNRPPWRMGGSPFKPQTVLFALEPRRGTRRHPARPGFELQSFRSEHQNMGL